MGDVLAAVASNTESTRNAGNAILYECVQVRELGWEGLESGWCGRETGSALPLRPALPALPAVVPRPQHLHHHLQD